jgi:hypothetical protein
MPKRSREKISLDDSHILSYPDCERTVSLLFIQQVPILLEKRPIDITAI